MVLQLVNELGFDGVDAGGLDDSWRQQPGTPVYDKDSDSTGVRHTLAEAQKEHPLQFRASSPIHLTSMAAVVIVLAMVAVTALIFAH